VRDADGYLGSLFADATCVLNEPFMSRS
jgi:hypothetical protein